MVLSTLSVDLDGYRANIENLVLRAYYGLYADGASNVTVAVSSSGEGFHVTGHFDTVLPLETKFRLRENYGDDRKRLRLDRQRAERGLPIDTNWTRKGGRSGVRYEYESAEEALQHVIATRKTPYEAVHALQNRGHGAVDGGVLSHTMGVKYA